MVCQFYQPLGLKENFKMKYLILFLLFLTSCMDSKFKKSSSLDSLRVLTIKADQPEVAPGTTVILTPFVSDINETASLTYSASGCIDPGVSLGADPECSASSVIVSNQTITTLNSSSLFTGDANTISVTIPATDTIFAGKSSIDQFNGVSYLFTYRLSNSSGQTVKSFKRIVVSTKTTKNANPSGNSILGNGSVLSAYPFGFSGKLSLSVNSSSLESYQFQDSNSAFTSYSENLLTSWHYTDGTSKFLRTVDSDEVQFDALASSLSSRKSLLIAIIRDKRGGVQTIRLQGP
jgi:hypothetical protein